MSPDADLPPFVPDATLNLVDPDWRLELRCACGRSADIPHKLLAKAHGPRASVPGLLARFRCGACGKSPIAAEWIDSAAGGPPSYPVVRRVPLRLPPPAPS